jgi:hypothetical protein
VDREFIESLNSAGYKDLDAEELVRLRDHGVNPFRLSGAGLEYDPDEIKQARLGFKSGEQRPADAFAPHFLCDVRALELSDLRPEFTRQGGLAEPTQSAAPDWAT